MFLTFSLFVKCLITSIRTLRERWIHVFLTCYKHLLSLLFLFYGGFLFLLGSFDEKKRQDLQLI